MSKVVEDQLNLCNKSNNKNSENTKMSNNTNAQQQQQQQKYALPALKDTLTNTATAMLQRNQFTPSSDASNASFSSASVTGSIQDDMSDQCGLTQAGLEEYNIRALSYYDQSALYHHQKQSSYAQSEGYHSYVSSSDSSSATPFLDRLRQESDLLSRQSHHWSQNDLSSVSSSSIVSSPSLPLQQQQQQQQLNNNQRDSGNGNGIGNNLNHHHHHNHHNHNHQQQQQQQNNKNNTNNSSESTSSTETLKWLGSMSDVSEASHATGYSALSESISTSQLIVHSSRVLTPKRHHSESVLYLNNEQQQNHLQQQQHQHYHDQQHSPNLSKSNQQFTQSTGSELGPPNHRHSPSYPPVHATLSLQPYHQHPQQQQSYKCDVDLPKSSLLTTSLPKIASAAAVAAAATLCDSQKHKSSISVTISNSESVPQLSPHPPPLPATKQNHATSNEQQKCSKSSTTNSGNIVLIGGDGANGNYSATNIVNMNNNNSSSSSSSNHGSSGGSGNSGSSSSSSEGIGSPASTTSYRSNHRLFPVSTYTEPIHSNTSQYVHHPKPQYSMGLQKPLSTGNIAAMQIKHHAQQGKLSPQQTWQSVAELISDFERSSDQQPQQKYSYIDPNKMHRVPNPALKAIQKNAVQSYFERQQQQQTKDHNLSQQKIYQSVILQQQQQQQQQQLLRPHSFQANASSKDLANQQLLRSSLPNKGDILMDVGVGLPQSVSMYSVSTCQLPSPQKATISGTPIEESPAHSPAPPPPPPRSRSLMPTLLRRSSSASDYAEFREQYNRGSQDGALISPQPSNMSTISNVTSAEKSSFNDCGMPPPPPPPRGRVSLPVRRTSSASEYAAMREKVLLQKAAALAHQQHHPHQHKQIQSQYYTPPPPLPPAANEGWVPERPPKNPNLRVPSPDLPPPPTTESDTNLSDEPLPPPPPELLHRQQFCDAENRPIPVSKVPSPNRRNSFAGSSSTRKAFFSSSRSNSSTHDAMPVQKSPPLIPKKPTSIEFIKLARPNSSLAQSSASKPPHKVIINGDQSQQYKELSSKVGANRKRPHHPALLTVRPILENPTNTNSKTPLLTTVKSPITTAITTTTAKSSPPPLMPRMTSGNRITSKLRCNSKASYLPRQSLEKLNNIDPDHGSYKLTLSSNEDLVTNSKPGYEILTHNGKLQNNLPDVLPLGAKLQPQPVSPTTAISTGAPLRYGSNNNLATTNASGYPIYPTQHRYSSPTSSNNNNNNIGTPVVPSYTRSQSHDVNRINAASPNKHISQSTIDLKKIQSLETTYEESLLELTKKLSPAQSENALNSSPKNLNSDNGGSGGGGEDLTKRSAEIRPTNDVCGEGRIFRAELVSATLSSSNSNRNPNVENSKTVVIRKDSLRENIEKITQLQSQLMSAHISDNMLLSSYSAKSNASLSTNPDYSINNKSDATTADHSQDVPNEDVEETKAETPCQLLEIAETATEVPQIEATDPPSSLCLPSLPDSPPPPTSSTPTHSPTHSLSTTLSSITLDSNDTPTPISQMDTTTDGLKLMQRSEIILRVNPTTAEAASQTDDLPDYDLQLHNHQHNKEEQQTQTRLLTLQPRERHPIEIECDNIARELFNLLPSNDKLSDMLNSQLTPKSKSSTDYVSNLYNPNVPLRPTKRDVGTSTLMRMKSIRECNKNMMGNGTTLELQYTEIEVSLTSGKDASDYDPIKKKMDEFMKYLKRKIQVLRREQTTIDEEAAINDELGSSLARKFANSVRPIEATKFRTYIDDIGHITSLLLSLSERLARAENSLNVIVDKGEQGDETEKKILETKRDRLYEQLEEAKRLKEDINRRGMSVKDMLEKNLSADEFADFEYFINMKAKLIADARDITDKIKSGEEKMNALIEALLQSEC